MLLVLALAVFVVLVPALCVIAWVLCLRDLAERTGFFEWLSDTFTDPVVFLFCVILLGVCLWTFLFTDDPVKAFVIAPTVCVFVGSVGWAWHCGSEDGVACATLLENLRPAHPATLELPVCRLPLNAQDARPVMRLVVGNIERERPVERRRRQSEESDENGRRLLVLTPEQRESYRRYLADEHWYD